jgi:hypothetical protein
MRLHAQTAMIENGFVHIPETAPWLAEYLHEMTVFPKGKHDDQVDSTAQFLDWFKKPFPGQGLLEFMRMQAERLRNPLNLERYRVRLQAPRGIGAVQTFSGRHIDVGPDGTIEMSADDAQLLICDGWTKARRVDKRRCGLNRRLRSPTAGGGRGKNRKRARGALDRPIFQKICRGRSLATHDQPTHRLRGGQGTRSGSRVSDQPRERDPRLLVSKRGPPSGAHRGFARLPEVSGTEGSNPLCSSGESTANSVSGTWSSL